MRRRSSSACRGVDFITPNIAVVRVVAEFNNFPRLRETYLVTEDAGEWEIRIHQAEQDQPPN